MKLAAIRVTGSEARALVAKGALLVDVRSEGEHAGGAIEGSINIPIQELSGRMDELGDKDAEVVVYCQSGGRSAMAKRLLEKNGFTKVHDLGGIGRW
ncbi:MAG: rhodanese-like domain-containing protein [Deltaproteobacteria bacterium]|nr:rhodanese-like domain-containing protein [Deltaproteobacteria bacterium]